MFHTSPPPSHHYVLKRAKNKSNSALSTNTKWNVRLSSRHTAIANTFRAFRTPWNTQLRYSPLSLSIFLSVSIYIYLSLSSTIYLSLSHQLNWTKLSRLHKAFNAFILDPENCYTVRDSVHWDTNKHVYTQHICVYLSLAPCHAHNSQPTTT